jgi:magnesium transporter
MITVNVHRNGAGVEETVPITQISDVLKEPNQILWVDVEHPTADDLRTLEEEFGFHPLAIEDATQKHERPKILLYQRFVFIVFYALEMSAGGELEHQELALFIGQNYVVTVHDAPVPVLNQVQSRWRQNAPVGGKPGTGLLVYSILDAIVDDYFPVVDALAERIEEIEEIVLNTTRSSPIHELFRLKRDMVQVRRVVAPERDVLNVLVRRDTPMFDEGTILYFQDVYDHILRVTDAIDTYRDLLSGALDAYLSVTSNRLNQVMKTLTASSIILMTITLVASIYGMNFDNMPELHWRLGYLWAIGLMVGLAGILIAFFRRIDYL